MYVRSKHSPKKPGSSRMKDSANHNSSFSKHKESKYADYNQPMEDKEIVLPVLKAVDPEKYLQMYSAILNRPKEEGIGIEDLDRLQIELEMVLSNVVLRQRTLHSEIEHLSTMEETKSKRVGASLSVGKIRKHRKFDDRNDSDTVDTDNANENKDSINSLREMDDTEDESVDEFKEHTSRHHLPKRNIPLVPPSLVPISKVDVSYKFWSTVDPYCADISAEDVKFLEDLIRSYDLYEKEDFKKIPPLGTHYALRWAQKDSKDDKETSSWNKSENDVDEEKDTKEIDPITAKNYVPGPMVQRLVSALVEEHAPSSSGTTKRSRHDKESNENLGPPIAKKSKDSNTNGFISSNGGYSEMDQKYRKLPFYHSSQCFEKKVRKELEAIGFLDPMNETNQEDTDEVLSELKRCHDELESVAMKNKKILQHLLQIAKTESRKKEIKARLNGINSALTDVYRTNHPPVKSKKKHMSKKEAEDAWKLLKERESLLLKLEEMSS